MPYNRPTDIPASIPHHPDGVYQREDKQILVTANTGLLGSIKSLRYDLEGNLVHTREKSPPVRSYGFTINKDPYSMAAASLITLAGIVALVGASIYIPYLYPNQQKPTETLKEKSALVEKVK